MAHLLRGSVQKGDRGEYGIAQLDLTGVGSAFDCLFRYFGRQQVWDEPP